LQSSKQSNSSAPNTSKPKEGGDYEDDEEINL
jgi:hypothetical protein